MLPLTLAAGSKEAVAAGCTCPVADNNNGKGIMFGLAPVFWYTEGCPIHDETHEDMDTADEPDKRNV